MRTNALVQSAGITHNKSLPAAGCIIVVLAAMSALPAACQPAGRAALPPGWTTRVLCSCDDAAALRPAYDAEALRRGFAIFNLASATETKIKGSSIKWHVRPRAADSASVTLARPIRDPFDALSVWVMSSGTPPAGLGIELVDRDGTTWSAPSVPLGGGRDWRQLTFAVADFRTAPDPRKAGSSPTFPLTSLRFTLSGLAAGADYVVYLDEIEAQTALDAAISVVRTEAAASIPAGGSLLVGISVVADAKVAGARTLRLKLMYGDTTIAALPLRFAQPMADWPVGEPQPAQPVTFALPTRLRSGDYRLVVEGLGCRVNADRVQSTAGVKVVGREKPLQADVSGGDGLPTLAVDGKPLPSLGTMLRGSAADATAGAAGHLYSFPAAADFDVYGLAADVALGPNSFDYSSLDDRIAAILQADPQALLIPRVGISSPPWWDTQHPTELMVFADGSKLLPGSFTGRKRTMASWASPAWRKDAADWLKRLIHHIADGPFADHVIGYQIASGERGEWRYWGASEGLLADYSHPQHEAYRRWLQTRYGGLENLREAWGQPRMPMTTPEALKVGQPIMEWDQVKVPGAGQRLTGDGLALLDPVSSQPLIDYQVFHSVEVADTVSYFARVAKEASGAGRLCGVAYGDLFGTNKDPSALQSGGQFALTRLLRDPNIDFLVSPELHAADPSLASAEASIRAHGKLVLDLSTAVPGNEGWRLPTAIRRAAAAWLSAIGDGRDRERAAQAAQALVDADRPARPQIAVIADDRSAAYTRAGTPLLRALMHDQVVELDRLGAPYDVWLLSDLLAGRAPEYRFYVFLDAFVLSQEERLKLRGTVVRDGKTLIWVYGAGAIDETISGLSMRDITGLAITMSTKPTPLEAKVLGGNATYTPDIETEMTYGVTTPLAPAFFCLDAQAETLGSYTSGRAALVARRFSECTSIYSATPALPSALLRGFAKAAGVHVYSETDDPIWMTRSLIGLRALTAGTKRVLLPGEADVYDIVGKRVLARGAKSFSIELSAGETLVAYVGRLADIGVKD